MNTNLLFNKRVLLVVSILIPLVVAVLYLIPKNFEVGEGILILPKLNAVINGITFLVLIGAFISILRRNVVLHKRLMLSALILSVLFLLSYVTYHSLTESTPYGGIGVLRTIYFIILITHILLAIAIVPLVLITFSRALSERFDKHKKIARITLPIWLYVTFTGVVVYLMISPYY
jgi:putative membrane protein